MTDYINSITVKTSAKINLSLDVVNRRSDGYHSIKSIFQSIGLFDTVKVTKTREGIKVLCDRLDLPCGSDNTAYKAASMFFEHTGKPGGVDIEIHKKIPSEAGLGGGSSDGAAVLYCMNKLFKTRMTTSQLAGIGGRISADTAFFIFGGTAFVEGIGDIINPIRSLAPFHVVVAKGKAGISTPQAYRKIDGLTDAQHPKTGKLLKAIDSGKFLKKCELCENIFELVADNRDVIDLKNHMLSAGAKTAVMSGSGSSVFGIFEKKEEALSCTEDLRKYFYFSHYCTATAESIYEI